MEDNPALLCSICLCPLTDFNDKVRIAALFGRDRRSRVCRHFFHADCIRQVSRKECPLCRRTFSRIRSIQPRILAKQNLTSIVQLILKLSSLHAHRCHACGKPDVVSSRCCCCCDFSCSSLHLAVNMVGAGRECAALLSGGRRQQYRSNFSTTVYQC